MPLIAENCQACKGDVPGLTAEEIVKLGHQVPDWTCHVDKGQEKLTRTFNFPDFAAALNFTNRVGEMAELEGHHPAILTEWGRVGVSWWTHKIGGLHRNDFVCAAKTDSLFKSLK